MPINASRSESRGQFQTTAPDVHRELQHRLTTVVDTPSFAEQIKQRTNEAYRTVFSALHDLMVRSSV
jgi:hypothetical protein